VSAVDAAPQVPATPPISGFVFDVDGTLLLSDRSLGGYEVLPGAIETLTALKERSIPFVLLTNGSAYPPPDQDARLREVGLPVESAQMITPSSVTADLMSRRRVKRALVLGTRGVGHALRERGVETLFTGEPGAGEVDAVYVGWHPDCGMKDIEAACHAIWGGAKLYVASDVPFFATKQGRTIGYTYAIVGAIRRVTRARAILTGKPSLHALRFAAARLDLPVRDIGVVGDDPLVEAAMARRGGAVAFGVTTGVATVEDWSRQPPRRRPDRVVDDLRALLACLPQPGSRSISGREQT
jgi:4-nitrophenyl phosphatase